VRPDGIIAGEERMRKVIGRVVRHAQPFHDSPRAMVRNRREGDDLVQPELLEAKGEGGACALSGVPVSPVFACEAPTDLHGRGEVGVKARLSQTYEAEEWGALYDLNRPQTPASVLNHPSRALCESVALRASERRREVAHHLRVGI